MGWKSVLKCRAMKRNHNHNFCSFYYNFLRVEKAGDTRPTSLVFEIKRLPYHLWRLRLSLPLCTALSRTQFFFGTFVFLNITVTFDTSAKFNQHDNYIFGFWVRQIAHDVKLSEQFKFFIRSKKSIYSIKVGTPIGCRIMSIRGKNVLRCVTKW